ncbi:MAG: hypothetical protein ACXW2T_02890 [Allosphingosinicella sp.]
MNLRFLAVTAAPFFLIAAPAAAQNSSAEPPVVAAPPPTTKSDPAPLPRSETPATTPSTNVEPVDPVPAPSTRVIVNPSPQTVPLEPVTIDPDAAYPDGFADPADPFSNELSVTYRQQQGGGFPWGLLGLLGLLGLTPLFKNKGERIVYVQRDEEVRRPVRNDPPA